MKRFPFAIAALSAVALFLNISTASAADSVYDSTAGNSYAPMLEITFGMGAMELDKARTGIGDDNGVGLNTGIRFNSSTVPLGAEWRLYGGSFSIDDSEHPLSIRRYGSQDLYYKEGKYSIIGSDFSLLWNINPYGVLNPYIGMGFLYETTIVDSDLYTDNYYTWRHHYHRHCIHEDWEEEGTTFLARVGLDVRAGLLHARLDASYMGEIYDDDDDCQFLLSGDLGVNIASGVRVDGFCHYYTEYKSFYIGGRVTVTL